MKVRKTFLNMCISLIVLICSVMLFAAPMGTAFTYQGRLLDDNVAADGVYDFQFKLYDDPNTLAGTQIGSTLMTDEVDVLDGYFIAKLDFGSSVFSGDARWLEVAVRPGASTDPNDYVALSPLQPISPTPYAMYADGSDWNNLANMPAGFADGIDNDGGSDLDWTISGNNMYSAVSGNVGVGTETPSEKLEVNGNIKANNLPGCEFTEEISMNNIPTTWTNIRSVQLTLNAGGYVIVTFSGTVRIGAPSGYIFAGVGTETNTADAVQVSQAAVDGEHIPFSVQHVYEVASPGTYTYYGNAYSSMGFSNIYKAKMTAIYVPNRY